MITAVIDTHALIWYLYDDARLSNTARQFMETAADSQDQIALSSITLIDMPDRIIAATAIQRNVPVISRDGKIRISNIQTIW